MVDETSIRDKGESLWRLLIEAGLRIEEILADCQEIDNHQKAEKWMQIDYNLKVARIAVAKESRWIKEDERKWSES